MPRIPSVAELRAVLARANGDDYRALIDAARDVASSCADRDLQRTAKAILNMTPHSNPV